MKIRNLNKLVCILSSGFILVNVSGCSIVANDEDSKVISSTSSLIQNDSDIVLASNKKVILKDDVADSELSKDEIILNYFEDTTEKIDDLLDSKNAKKAKQKCKEYFITFVDFIFYEGTINDITFDELTDETKMKVIKIVKKLDKLMMKKFPNYKESISGKSKELYNKASDLLSKGKNNLEDYVILKIGDDEYQDVVIEIDEIKNNDKETWSMVKDTSDAIINSGKEKVKTWYKNFKNN